MTRSFAAVVRRDDLGQRSPERLAREEW